VSIYFRFEQYLLSIRELCYVCGETMVCAIYGASVFISMLEIIILCALV